MNILLMLIPVSLLLVGLIAWMLLWAGKSGQFDDLEGPAHSIIMDDDTPVQVEATAQDSEPHRSLL
ncbi:MAG: cbb3-type cytochrome oxidase assembly protein CcoS [Thiobacillaceae bacterium]